MPMQEQAKQNSLEQDHNEQFKIEEGILKAYTGPDAEVVVPEGVHTIGEGVFKGMAWILKVTLPATLKRIEDTAFKGCRQLKEINIPEGLLSIGEYAFHRCHQINEFVFPKTLTEVGNCAFLYCDGLKKVVMEGPKRLGKGTFSHNLSLREIALNREVDDTNFGDEVFEGCVCLHKITLSGEVYEIDNLIGAMNSHTDYPQVVKSIARSVFHSMQIEDGVIHSFNVNLKAISLPEGITGIGKSCFYDKKGIVSIIMPKSLREISANAFLNCISLEEVTIQNPDLILDEKAFRGCCNLKKVNVLGESYSLVDEAAGGMSGRRPVFEAREMSGRRPACAAGENAAPELVGRIRDQVMGDFYISGKILVRYMGDEEQIQIPKEVEIIGERCFFGKERLKTVLCPEGLLEIREQAFEGCLTLQNIVLPEGLKRVEREAFAECKKLLKCNLPETLEYIGEYAFRRCFLLKPFDPWPKKAKIHPYAFYKAQRFEQAGAGQLDCKQAVHISVRGNAGCEAGGENMIAPYAHLRDGNVRILTLTGMDRIGKYAFASCPNLEEIVIDAPQCVLEQNVFSACPKLRKVCLRVKELGKGTFSYCRNLEEVHLSGVSLLPAECFAGDHLLSIFDAAEITQMEARCFDECIHLNSFDFSGIRRIGERAFERCDSLRSVELGKVECGFHAFADCAALESVTISEDTVLRSGAFIGCTQVKTITLVSEKAKCVVSEKDKKSEGKMDAETYEFSRFTDGLNHTDNPYPLPVREVIASIYSCFDVRERKYLAGYSQDATRITIPQDIEEIWQDVFRDHVRLQEISIPKSVKIFGGHAFSMTSWLEEQRKKTEMVIVNQILLDGASCKGKVVIPPSVKRIASWCFAGNIHVTELVIPSDRIAVENLSFRNCLNLKKITDWDGKEYALRSVTDLSQAGYPELVQRIFSECINCFKLDADGNLVESTGNITDLTFPEGIRSVGDGVYQDCHLLESIALSVDTKSIGKSAFENSKWLRSVTGAGGVCRIGALAFSGCQSLESIDLSEQVTEMGSRCFEHCASLKEIHLSGQLEKIPERAFFRCKALRKVYVPKSVKTIEAEAFAFCDGLEKVMIGAETQVSENAFAFCERVKIERY